MSDGPAPESTRHRGRSLHRWLLLALALAVGVYVVAIVVIGGDEARDALAGARRLPLLGALALEAVVTLTWPMVHRASLRAVGHDLRYRQALEVSLSAFAVSHTVPGGGAVGAAVAVERLGRFGVPGPVATSSVALTGPVSVTTIAGLGAVGIGVTVVAGQLPGAALVVAVLAVLALVALVVGIVVALHSPAFGVRVIRRIGRLHDRLGRRAAGWEESWHTVTEHAPSVGRTARVFAWSAVKWSADVGALAMVFVALGLDPRPSVLLVGFGASQLLAAVPSTPGSVGVVEGGMVGAFTILGVPSGAALSATVLYRIFETWLPTLAGLPVLLRAGRR